MSTEITPDDEAKDVVAGDGAHVGIVDEVRDGTAYVNPDADVEPERKSKLGWGPDERSTYPLRSDAIDEVTDEAVRLRDSY